MLWILEMTDVGETDIVEGDILENHFVQTELGYLTGGYEDERDEFLADVERAKRIGRGSATIEERMTVTLKRP